jgi:hypothetical protein
VWSTAGGRVLFDSKNLVCYPSQATVMDGGSILKDVRGASWPVTTSSGHTYNSTTGRIKQFGAGGGSNVIQMENSGQANAGAFPIFNNPAHDYAGFLWFYVSASAFTVDNPTLLSKGSGTGGTNTNSLVIAFDVRTKNLRVLRPGSADALASNTLTASSVAAGIHRIAFAWTKASGQWKRYGRLDSSTALTGNDSVDTFGSGTNGINLPAGVNTWDLSLFGNIGNGFFNDTTAPDLSICRFYIENLTLSARSYTAMWDLDWQYANGRFS